MESKDNLIKVLNDYVDALKKQVESLSNDKLRYKLKLQKTRSASRNTPLQQEMMSSSDFNQKYATKSRSNSKDRGVQTKKTGIRRKAASGRRRSIKEEQPYVITTERLRSTFENGQFETFHNMIN